MKDTKKPATSLSHSLTLSHVTFMNPPLYWRTSTTT